MLKLLRPALSTSAARIYAQIASLVFLLLTARILGAEGRGMLAVILTWVRLVAGLSHFSLGQTTIHIASNNTENKWLPQTLSNVLTLSAFLGALAILVHFAAVFFFKSALFGENFPRLLLYPAALLIPLIMWEQCQNQVLQAANRLRSANRALVWGRTLTLISTPILFVLGLGGAVLATFFGQVLTVFHGVKRLLLDAGTLPKPEISGMKDMLGNGAKLHLGIVSALIIASTDILLINVYHGATQSGFYQMASQLAMAMMLIPQSLGAVMMTRVSSVGADTAWLQTRKLIWIGMGLMVALAIIAALLIPYILPTIFGEEFTPSVSIFQWLMWTVLGQTLAALMAPQWLARGYFGIISATGVGLALLNLTLNFLLIPEHGAMGAIIATIITYAISTLINLLFLTWLNLKKVT